MDVSLLSALSFQRRGGSYDKKEWFRTGEMRKKFLRARGETGHITFTVLRGTRVSSYVAPENRQSREHRRGNGLPLSLYLSISVYLPIYLILSRLNDCVERKIDFQARPLKLEVNFFSSGEPVAKETMSRKMFLRETKKRLLNETGYDLRGWL